MANFANINVNVPITQIQLKRVLDHETFIVDKIFKPVPTVSDTGTYTKWDNSHLRIEDSKLGPHGIANIVKSNVSITGNFNVEDYALKEFLSDKELTMAYPTIRPQLINNAASGVVDRLWIQKEKKAADMLFNTSTFAGSTEALGSGTQFDDPSNTSIFEQIGDAAQTVKNKSGKRANTIIMGSAIWAKLRNRQEFLARLKTTADAKFTTQAFQNLLNYDNLAINQVLVGDEQYNAAKEGQVDNFVDLWGNYFLVCYIEPGQNSTANVSLAKNFTRGGQETVQMRVFKKDPEETGNWYRANTAYDLRVIMSAAGYLFSNVIST